MSAVNPANGSLHLSELSISISPRGNVMKFRSQASVSCLKHITVSKNLQDFIGQRVLKVGQRTSKH